MCQIFKKYYLYIHMYDEEMLSKDKNKGTDKKFRTCRF